MDLINFQSTTIWKFVLWTGIHCVGPLLQLRNDCIAPITCNGMEVLLCISMMILEFSQNGCDVLCKARSYITALLTKTTAVEASKPLSGYLPVQIWQLESCQKGWNVKSASFLPHNPFIGGSMGCKGAPPPHPTPQDLHILRFHAIFRQICMLVPFPQGVGSAPSRKSWICHFCKFLQITSA